MRSPSYTSQIRVLPIHAQLLHLVSSASDNGLTQKTVDVVVQKQIGIGDGFVERQLALLGGEKTLDLSIINGFAAKIPIKALEQFSTTPGIRWISPDGEIQLSSDSYKPDRALLQKNDAREYRVFVPSIFSKSSPGTKATTTPTITSTPTPNSTATSIPTVTATPISSQNPTPTPTTYSVTFFKGINLGGGVVTIDGNVWEAQTTTNVTLYSDLYDRAPSAVSRASGDFARMLKDGVHDYKGNSRVNMSGIPYGVYDVIIYNWEFNSPQMFNVYIEGRMAQTELQSAKTGEWKKLGPYRVLVMDGELNINTSGGLVNISGVEIWKVNMPEEPSIASGCLSIPRTLWSAKSSVTSTFPITNSFDAIITSRWSTSSQIEGMWYQLDMGSSKPFDTIEVISGRYPALEYKLQVSDVDGNWDRVPVLATARGAGDDTFAMPPTNARFIRLTLSRTFQEAIWAIYDLNVFDCASLPTNATGSNTFNEVIGVNKLRQAKPQLQGQGIGVAILDSGINETSDLNTLVGVNRVLVNVRLNDDQNQSPDDGYGHGNHIAGIIGGNGTASTGKYIGVAPGVNLINVKVSNDDGSARSSRIIAGMQWILQNRDKYNIRIVNISLNNSNYESYHTSPLSAAAEILWFNNIVVVVSAGNKGNGNLYPPANDPFVITVGAIDDKGTADLSDDTVPNFSAYGTTPEGVTKPDLVAPGVNIIGLRPNQNSTLSNAHPLHNVGDSYFRMSGTSMAAPMVTGAIALLLQAEPDLTPDQVKYRLKATATKIQDPQKTGAGLLDIQRAINTRTNESANTHLRASNLLTTGESPVNSSVSWNSVSWNSVSWNSVSWNSVSWNSVSWNSVSWNSDHWETP
jgi:serine protease AprX